MGRGIKNTSADEYLKLLMYTVERTDKQSVFEAGSGEFVSIVDLEVRSFTHTYQYFIPTKIPKKTHTQNFSWSTSPSISLMKECMDLLKKHYPYRMGGIFIVNAGMTFNLLWNVLKPLMPRRALAKTFNLGKARSNYAKKILEEKIGLEHLEKSYGGMREVDEGLQDIDAYFKRGYWYKQHSGQQL